MSVEVSSSNLNSLIAPRAQYYPRNVRETFAAEAFRESGPLGIECTYAKIGYEFNEKQFIERTICRLETGGLQSGVPDGWPRTLAGPLVWTRGDFSDESQFVYTMTDSDKIEVLKAVEHFKGLGIRPSDVGPTTFPIPTLGKTLSKIKSDIYEGRGFATLRGLDVDALSADDLVTVYLGITSYIAERRGKQNPQGVMMINVVNNSAEVERENSKIQMPFHTDLVCDIVAMLTMSCGDSGGTGIIASAWTVYNELARTRPDLIHVLAEPNWPFDTHGRDPPYYKRALMYMEDGKLLTNFSRRSLVGQKTSGPRTLGIPGLSESQADALDTLHAIGRRHEIKQPMVKGDIRFLNNLAVMHRRDTFTDSERNHRQLLRLWLHNESSCWELPADLQLAWKRTFYDNERKEEWHIVKFGTSGDCFVEPLWEGHTPTGPHPGPPPPVSQCD